jgi:hypothetical protein
VGVAALFCAWCAALRNRANVQDSLIAEIEKDGQSGVYLERWGPKWLDLVGADRFRRRIVGAYLRSSNEICAENLLRRLGRFPNVRYLNLTYYKSTPGMAAALGDIAQLKILVIQQYQGDDGGDVGIRGGVLAAIGKLNHLEVLSLDGSSNAFGSLARLAGLTNLKSLRLYNDVYYVYGRDEFELEDSLGIGELPLFASLPALPRLEAIWINPRIVRGDVVRQLAVLPRLKSLSVSKRPVTGAAWAKLASLESLEELAIDEVALAARLKSLLAIKRLKALHIFSNKDDSLTTLPLDKDGQLFVRESDVDACRRALEALRRSKPGIVIDAEGPPFPKHDEWHGSFDYFPPKADRSLPTMVTGMGVF